MTKAPLATLFVCCVTCGAVAQSAPQSASASASSVDAHPQTQLLNAAGQPPTNLSGGGSQRETPNGPEESGFTIDQAVQVALQRNRDVVAARLDIQLAEYDRVAARLYPNPVISYQTGNLVLGRGNSGNDAPRHPGMFSQMVQTIGVSELIDIWNKRGYRTKAADEGIQYHRLLLEDVLREVTHAVRSAFADVLRERAQLDFTHEVAARYSDTVRLSRSRFEAGEISESELRKIELEGLKYQNGLVDAQLEYDLARQQLAALLALSSEAGLPATLTKPPVAPQTRTVAELTQQALRSRPDYLAVAQSRRLAQATVSAAHREVYPDLTLGVAYTHSSFLASGDNPNAWGLAASMPVPVFDRNQANIGRANVNLQSTENDGIRLELSIRHAVAEATRKLQRAEALLGIYTTGGMLDRAETSLRVAERSYKTGATSLLGLLEAQRTYLETRDDYLRAVNDEQQSAIDLEYAVGKKLQ